MVRSSGAHQQRTEPTSRIILDTVPIRVCVCWIAASQRLAPACFGLGSKLLRRGNRNLRLKGRARARPDKFRSLKIETMCENSGADVFWSRDLRERSAPTLLKAPGRSTQAASVS